MSTVHFSSTITTIQYSDDITKLAPAFHAAQSEMGPAILDSTNPAFRSKFASLSSVLNASVSVLNKHGISVQQHAGFNDETKLVQVTTVLMHKSGQRVSSTCGLPLGGKRDGHAYKSATTYLRRISLIGICGLAEADDDGNAASVVAPRRAAPPITVATEEQLSQYRSDLEDKGFDPKLVADFFHTHGKPSAAKGSMDQLVKRGMWVARNYPTIQQWGEQR